MFLNSLFCNGVAQVVGQKPLPKEDTAQVNALLKESKKYLNEDEVKELRKFYDFSDFADALIKFSAKNDKGFVRMKTYSNPFVVPVQIGLFK